MPRFDLYRNPNPKATHALYLDVQSDLVSTSTRWCVPLLATIPGQPLITNAQQRLIVDGQEWLLDTPNILAIPMAMLRVRVSHLSSDGKLLVESALDFMLRGY